MEKKEGGRTCVQSQWKVLNVHNLKPICNLSGQRNYRLEILCQRSKPEWLTVASVDKWRGWGRVEIRSRLSTSHSGEWNHFIEINPLWSIPHLLLPHHEYWSAVMVSQWKLSWFQLHFLKTKQPSALCLSPSNSRHYILIGTTDQMEGHHTAPWWLWSELFCFCFVFFTTQQANPLVLHRPLICFSSWFHDYNICNINWAVYRYCILSWYESGCRDRV